MSVIFVERQIQIGLVVKPPEAVIEGWIHTVVRLVVRVRIVEDGIYLRHREGRFGRKTVAGFPATEMGPTIQDLVGGVQNHTRVMGVTQAAPFLGREELLLDLSRESMKALGVGLGHQVGQVSCVCLAQFPRGGYRSVGSSGTLVQTMASEPGKRRG